MLGYTQIRPCFQSRHLRWTDAFFQGALDYAGIQGFAPVGTKALNLVAGTHLLKVGSSLGWGQGFLFYSSPKKAIDFSTTHRTSVRRRQSCVFLPRFEGNKKPPATARGFSVSDEFAVRKRARLAVLHDDGAHGIGSLLASICCVLEALEQLIPHKHIQRVFLTMRVQLT